MPRFKLTVEYDGSGLAGWQKQEDRQSIQGLLEQAACKFSGQACQVIAAGRTDAGVHARAQVAHLDIAKEANPYNVMHGLNYHLLAVTSQVVVLAAERVSDEFHARFSATKRIYRYRILNRQARAALLAQRAWHVPERLDAEAMHKAAQLLIGHHDFSTFRSSECQSASPVKTLERLEVIFSEDVIDIWAEAQSFLHHQVRNMVGTLRLIGNGKWKPNDLQEAFNARDRKRGGETAPAHGLFLMQVQY